MMQFDNIKNALPTAQSVMDLAQEDFAGVLLRYFPSPADEYGLMTAAQRAYQNVEVAQAVTEGLRWLISVA